MKINLFLFKEDNPMNEIIPISFSFSFTVTTMKRKNKVKRKNCCTIWNNRWIWIDWVGLDWIGLVLWKSSSSNGYNVYYY